MPRKEYSRLSIALVKVPKSLVAQELAVRLMLFMGELCHSRWFYYYDEAIAAFAESGDESGAKAQIAGIMELKYQQAVMLRENGQYEEAIAAFLQLGGNSDNAR